MMTKKKQSQPVRWLSLFTLVAILAGCKSTPPTVTPTVQSVDPNAVRTAAAQTADARLGAIPSPTPNPPTPDAAQWTQTAEAQASPTVTLTPTAALAQPSAMTITPTITATVALATATAPSLAAGADNATYVKDVTIPDNTTINSGAKFTKTWQLRNAGSSTWTTQYEFVWVSGEKLGETTSVKMAADVPAGQSADISVELTAPTADGTYKGFWRMRNPSGQYFGDAVYVMIKVGAGGATAQPTAGPGTATTTPGTPTVTVAPSSAIGAVSVSINNTSVTAACPYKFVISANIEVKAAATVSYQLEAGGYALTLPSPSTQALGVGNYTFTYELEISQSGTGWARLHVTSPVDVTSNEVSFSLTCNP